MGESHRYGALAVVSNFAVFPGNIDDSLPVLLKVLLSTN